MEIKFNTEKLSVDQLKEVLNNHRDDMINYMKVACIRYAQIDCPMRKFLHKNFITSTVSAIGHFVSNDTTLSYFIKWDNLYEVLYRSRFTWPTEDKANLYFTKIMTYDQIFFAEANEKLHQMIGILTLLSKKHGIAKDKIISPVDWLCLVVYDFEEFRTLIKPSQKRPSAEPNPLPMKKIKTNK